MLMKSYRLFVGVELERITTKKNDLMCIRSFVSDSNYLFGNVIFS